MTTQLDQIAQRTPAPRHIGQATAVEQSRAVAEVQAAIVVAQQCPRHISRAIEDMRESCRRPELAERAFFRYSRGGSAITGPTIHLARELARVWGNIQYGLREMRRDDEASEMLAFAWDVQTNSRCDNIVINPHRRYAGGGELTELRDIYENNANVGARRVREAIFAVLPAWFTEEAKTICAKTLAEGGGVPRPTRIANAIEVFGNLGVTVAQLERKLGRPQARWDDQDVAQLRIIRQSLLRGEITKEEEFGSAGVTAADITAPAAQDDTQTGTRDNPRAAGGASARGAQPPAPQDASPHADQAGKPQLDKLADIQQRWSFSDDDTAELIRWLVPDWTATRAQIRFVAKFLEDHLEATEGDVEQARSNVWSQYLKATGQPAADQAGSDG